MKQFPLDAGWRALLKDLGINAFNVLRRAQLPDDLLVRRQAGLSTADYFRFWTALEAESGTRLFALRLLAAISADLLSPALFAALCSPNLREAAQRLARYKRLVAPMALDIKQSRASLALSPHWLEPRVQPPASLVVVELGFFVRLAAIGTRETIRAQEVVMPTPPQPFAPYAKFFGAAIRKGQHASVSFSTIDADKSFLTANAMMLRSLEPDLSKRLTDWTDEITLAQRVRALLMEALPGGRCAVAPVARRLALSARSLQRKLGDEGTTFKQLLRATRAELAHKYVADAGMSYAEIAFLLGFEDPNSFFRAFNAWTGSTPDAMRRSLARSAGENQRY